MYKIYIHTIVGMISILALNGNPKILNAFCFSPKTINKYFARNLVCLHCK